MIDLPVRWRGWILRNGGRGGEGGERVRYDFEIGEFIPLYRLCLVNLVKTFLSQTITDLYG